MIFRAEQEPVGMPLTAPPFHPTRRFFYGKG